MDPDVLNAILARLDEPVESRPGFVGLAGTMSNGLLEQLQGTTTSVFFVPDVFGISIIQGRLQDMNGVPVVGICETPFTGTNQLVKRLSDIVLAACILVLISPILLLVAVGVKLSSPGPIIFKQRRNGLDGEEIIVYKFRSMRTQDNGPVVKQATKGDPRITKFGAFIRRTSLDELPQFINVLQGRMSIVGPRPLLEASFNLYSPDVQARIYSNRPGLTGVGSIIFRDEEKLISEAPDPHRAYAAIYPYKGALEMWYIDNQSLTVDFLLMFLTGWAILFPENALAEKALNNLPQRQLAV